MHSVIFPTVGFGLTDGAAHVTSVCHVVLPAMSQYSLCHVQELYLMYKETTKTE